MNALRLIPLNGTQRATTETLEEMNPHVFSTFTFRQPQYRYLDRGDG
jgi:hypothetical protein